MPGNVFINYRRGDDPGFAGRLFDQLVSHFGDGKIFMDVDSIAPGQDFVTELDEQISKCDVLLAVIGPVWISMVDPETGKRRLDEETDFVRIEIESALKREILIIPVLVNDASMPRTEDLPESIQALARRNAVRLTHDRFKSDTAGLVASLEAAIQKAEKERQRLERVNAEAAEAEALIAEKDAAERLQEEQLDSASSTEQKIAALEYAEWSRIRPGAGERRDLERFIELFPNTEKAKNAAARITEIDESDAELQWRRISEAESVGELREYVARFSESEFAETARNRLEDLEELQIQAAWNDPSRLLKFLTENPDSSHAEKAKERLELLEKNEANRKRRNRFLFVGGVAAVAVLTFTVLGSAIFSAHQEKRLKKALWNSRADFAKLGISNVVDLSQLDLNPSSENLSVVIEDVPIVPSVYMNPSLPNRAYIDLQFEGEEIEVPIAATGTHVYVYGGVFHEKVYIRADKVWFGRSPVFKKGVFVQTLKLEKSRMGKVTGRIIREL